MEDVSSWVNVVTDPLGLAGFALFLVFGALAKIGRSRNKAWLFVAAISLAAIALIGGMILSWQKSEVNQQPASTVPTTTTQPPGEASQITYEKQSPAVQNVQGGVTINIGTQDNKPQDDKKD